MIFAEIHGKLGSNYSFAHERGEDLLTSTAFGLLRYVPVRDGILDLLDLARPLIGGVISRVPVAGWIDTSQVVRSEFDFWRSMRPSGQPDLVVRLYGSSSTAPIHVLVIEVKLYSGKSGAQSFSDTEEYEIEDNGTVDEGAGDQLARYWDGLLREFPSDPALPARSIIYLTAHGTAPVGELVESARCRPGMRLAWLSWHDVWHVAARAADKLKSLPACDLRDLLAHKGLSRFVGFNVCPALGVPLAPFWKRQSWFQASLVQPLIMAAGMGDGFFKSCKG